MKEMENAANTNYSSQMDSFDESKKNTTNVKNFKQELIKLLLLEVKRSTANLVQFNNLFFLDGLEKDSQTYNEYLICDSLNVKTNE
ncbi:hypothetical protein [Flavobacterium sp. SM2513]|uniref:hypothetical protein n=1 Tax=Flavobacterium sp. SM2513 TaxID=3424766 RepID=UPI003D7F2FCF